MMKLTFNVLLSLCLLVTGCATIKLTEQNALIVLAKEVEKEKGPNKISDVFTYEGNIYAYITFNWDVDKPVGPVNVEVKWFNGDKLISVGETSANFVRTPHYIWLKTRGTSLGAGKCRVDVYADGVFVGKKSFIVVEKQEVSAIDTK
jgi:hypothetical protein